MQNILFHQKIKKYKNKIIKVDNEINFLNNFAPKKEIILKQKLLQLQEVQEKLH